MSKKYESKENLQEALEHLEYELVMLFAMGNVLIWKYFGDGIMNNAVVESFAVHCRNIIEFFYEPKPSSKKDYVFAEHYFSNPSKWRKIRGNKPEVLRDAATRAAKQVSHLTYKRLSKESWNPPIIEVEIKTILAKFIEEIPDDILGKYKESFRRMI